MKYIGNMKINFKNFKVPTNLDKTNFVEIDIREEFGNMLYNKGTGIRIHSLAYKIFKSDEETDFDDQEVKEITEYVNSYGTPAFIDGLLLQTEKES